MFTTPFGVGRSVRRQNAAWPVLAGGGPTVDASGKTPLNRRPDKISSIDNGSHFQSF